MPKKLYFNYFWRKKISKIIWILILQIFRGQLNIVVCQVTWNLKTNANDPIG